VDLDDLDVPRLSAREQEETDIHDQAWRTATHWHALRTAGVPWLVAALLLVRGMATVSLHGQLAGEYDEDE